MFKYSDTNKRYHTLNCFLKHKFKCKVAKITLDGGFSCPNIDGTKGFGGCTYCDSSVTKHDNLSVQFNQVKSTLQKKWGDFCCIAYFAAHTNTYSDLATIKPMFEEVLHYDDVVGISVSTRADCLDDTVVSYLCDLNKRTFLTVELGLQTIHEDTAVYINRMHSYSEFLAGYDKLYSCGINICVHIINGLPHETHEMMVKTADAVSKLNPHSVKIHSLHILNGTKMAKQYIAGEFKLLERDEYVNIVCDQLEILPPQTVIERVTGDGDKSKLIAPLWSTDKRFVLNSIDNEMKRRNSFQGKLYEP